MEWWPWLVVAPTLSYMSRMVMVVLLFRVPFTVSEILSSNNSNASVLQLNQDGLNTKNDSMTEASSAEEIHCHCNMPVCVSTGYMCKTGGGACFTRYTPLLASQQHPRNPSHYQTLSSIPILGCLHLLPQALQNLCREKSRQEASSEQNTPPGSALLEKAVKDLTEESSDETKSTEEDFGCCGQDMCNYQDTPGIMMEGRSHESIQAGKQDTSVMGSVWFQTATVAVPVAGCIILVLLVLMAARILAKDSKRHRTYQVCGDHYFKTPLYSAMSTSSGPGGSGSMGDDSSYISQHSSQLPFCSQLHSTLEPSYEDSRIQPEPHYMVRPPPYREKNGVYCSYEEHHQIEELKPLNCIHDIKSCKMNCPSQKFKFLDKA